MNRRLVDTGPLVAYIGAADPTHDAVAATLDAYISSDPSGLELLVEFLATSATHVAEVTSVADLQEAMGQIIPDTAAKFPTTLLPDPS